MPPLNRSIAIISLAVSVAAPLPASAQTAPTAQQRAGQPQAAAPQGQRRAQPNAAKSPSTGNWWSTASDNSLSRRRQAAAQAQSPRAAQPQSWQPAPAAQVQTRIPGEAQAQAQPQAQGSKSRAQARSRSRQARAEARARRAEERVVARRAEAARRELARLQREEQESGVVKVASGAEDAATGVVAAEVARALGDVQSVKGDGRRALARGEADLAVAPSLDGGLGADGERVAKLFDAAVVLVGGPNVSTVGNIAGRPVEIGAADGEAAVAREALAVLGVRVEERRSPAGEALGKVAKGEVSAAVVVTVKGSETLRRALAANRQLQVVSLADAAPLERTVALNEDEVPDFPRGEDVLGLRAEVSLFARPGRAGAEPVRAAVNGLYGRIPQLLADGGAWWRSVPLAAEAADAKTWTPTNPGLASKERGDFAHSLQRVGLERVTTFRASAPAADGRRVWVVGD